MEKKGYNIHGINGILQKYAGAAKLTVPANNREFSLKTIFSHTHTYNHTAPKVSTLLRKVAHSSMICLPFYFIIQ